MSIELIKKAWAIDKAHLNASQKSVLTRMLGFGNDKGESIFPSIGRLEKETSLSRSTVKRAIKHLVDKKFLVKVQSAKLNLHYSNVYSANLSLLHQLAMSNETYKKEVKVKDRRTAMEYLQLSSDNELDDDFYNFVEAQTPRFTSDPPRFKNSNEDSVAYPPLGPTWHSVGPEKATSLGSEGGTLGSPWTKPRVNSNPNQSYIPITRSILNNNELYFFNRENFEGDLHESFELFWNAYPRKVSKAKAKKAFFQKCTNKKINPQVLIDAIQNQTKERSTRQSLGLMVPELIKGPASWLEDERWEDEVMSESQIRAEANAKWKSKSSRAERDKMDAEEVASIIRAKIKAMEHKKFMANTNGPQESKNVSEAIFGALNGAR